MGRGARQDWESRCHFVAIAAQHMRQILVDYARRQRAAKRGEGSTMISLDDSHVSPIPGPSIFWPSTRPCKNSPRWTRVRPARWN